MISLPLKKLLLKDQIQPIDDGVHNMDSLLWNQSLIVPATYPISLEEMVHPNGTS